MLKVGDVIKIVGCSTKNDNGVFEITSIWEKDFCCYKLKKNGEHIKSKYACNIFKYSFFDQYGIVINKTDIPAAITEVNKTLKEVKENEVVYSYIPSTSQKLTKGCYIQVLKYISTSWASGIGSDSIFKLKEINTRNSYIFHRIGQKGQELSILGNNNYVSFSEKTVSKLFAEGYICIVEQVQQIRKEMEQEEPVINEQVTKVKEEITIADEQPQTEETTQEPASQPKKIKTESIEFVWSESPVISDNTVVKTYKEADDIIQSISSQITTGGYKKTEIKITFTNEDTYTLRYDIQHNDPFKGNLSRRITEVLESYAGMRKPAGMTEESYKNMLKAFDNVEQSLYMLNTYNFQDTEQPEPNNSKPKERSNIIDFEAARKRKMAM